MGVAQEARLRSPRVTFFFCFFLLFAVPASDDAPLFAMPMRKAPVRAPVKAYAYTYTHRASKQASNQERLLVTATGCLRTVGRIIVAVVGCGWLCDGTVQNRTVLVMELVWVCDMW